MRITAAINCAPSFLLKLIRVACDRHKIKNSLLTLTCRALNLIYAPAASHLFSAAVIFYFLKQNRARVHITFMHNTSAFARESARPSPAQCTSTPVVIRFAIISRRMLSECWKNVILSLSLSIWSCYARRVAQHVHLKWICSVELNVKLPRLI
jgi:hypothetical protein